MTDESLQQLAQLVMQGMISIVFIWAWAQERKERQDQLKAFSLERETWMKELIELAREAYGLKARAVVTSPMSPEQH